ncbi:hypothetical protein DY000_02013310 [Brassica cretica]|uniref:NB-ARC domain-containing protein n=1 Tax=Brassica cretica TaxID=69181 RepID=A0ABQ7D7B9_BRACR|nr:hypothetical protein DY000_02013310 [Brassica cretica]
MEPLLCLSSDEVRMIGIWGPPGIGKTTIARVAFNQLFQLSVFMDDIKGSKNVIGMKFDYYKIEDELDISEKAFEGMSNLQFLKVYGYSDTLQLTRGLNYLSHKLRLLHWSHFPMTCFPCIVNSVFLVELVMDFSKLEKLWDGIIPLRSLKWMKLSFSVNLKELPDLSTATSLEKLNLNACSRPLLGTPIILNLVEFLSFIGNAVNLQKLDLSSFPNPLELPSYVGTATNLEKLDLRCSKLEVLPSSMNFESLEKLDLSGCASIENAVNLRTLDIIAELLLTNINLESLDVLNLRDCSMLKSFPQISTNIRALDLRGTAVEEVPPSIVSWPRLDQLQMSYFENLKECPHALERITWLCLTDTEIREVTEVEVMYKNSSHTLTQPLAEHMYIFQFRAEVTSSELLFEFKLKSDDARKIGECGLVQHLEVPSC